MIKTPFKAEAQKKLSVISLNSSVYSGAMLEPSYPFLPWGVLWIICGTRWFISYYHLPSGAEKRANLLDQCCVTGT